VTPEEEELEALQIDVDELERRLAAEEEALMALRIELAAFERNYRRRVAPRKARVDDLRLRLSVVSGAPSAEFDELQARATDSAKVATGMEEGAQQMQRPTEELRAVYRRIARLIHPDLAATSYDRDRRTALMARVNSAYEIGDLESLRQLEIESLPEQEDDKSVGGRLVRGIRRRAAARARLAMIEKERMILVAGPLAALWERAELAAAAGRDLVREMCNELDRQAAQLEAQLTTKTG